jgi:hypothetical protein
MNSPLELREVRLRGLRLPHAGQVHRGEVPQVKPRVVCEAFRSRCGGFSRSGESAAKMRQVVHPTVRGE